MIYLAALQAKEQKLAEEQWQRLIASLATGDRHVRMLRDMLAGNQPLNPDVLRRLPIDPEQKRVLLAVAARRYPEHEKELMPLARKLDFHRDVTSLCLRKVLE